MQDNQKGISMYELVRFNTKTGMYKCSSLLHSIYYRKVESNSPKELLVKYTGRAWASK